MRSATSILGEAFARLEERAVTFFRELGVRRGGREYHSGVVLIQPDYWWDSPSAQQRHEQIRLREEFLNLLERLRLLVSKAPPDVRERIEDASKHMLEWIDLDTNWSLSADPDRTERQVRSALKPFRQTLDLLGQGTAEVIVVPDTNAIAAFPDPRQYELIAGTPSYRFGLVPTVLAELDALKVTARNDTFRERVAATIKRIKGWRRQGPLLEGVSVDKTISVFAVAAEPDFSTSLAWLDRTNQDDRIVASLLELQRVNPAAEIILVTGDINLQNKADAAGLPWSELPDPA